MTAVWVTVGALALTTALIKAAGPVAFGGRDLSGLLGRAIPLLAPALLAALVVSETLGQEEAGVALDARAAGVGAAAVALALRAPVLAVVAVAAVCTALVRALG